MELGLSGRRALITGAASGIGRACAEALVAEGVRVGLLDRNERQGAALAAELGDGGADARFEAADITDEDQVARAVAAIATAFGGLDILVGCAGISGPFGRGIEEISLAEWNAVLAVNVTGPFLAAKHALPHLRAGADPAIVLIGSDSAFVAAPGMVPYNASKGAVLQFTRALATDLAPAGIRVNCLCPSIVDTPLSRSDLGLTEKGFAGADFPVQSPAEVARHVLYLAAPVSRPVNGTALVSDFGYLARSSFPA